MSEANYNLDELGQQDFGDLNGKIRFALLYNKSEDTVNQIVEVMIQNGVETFSDYYYWLNDISTAPQWFKDAVAALNIAISNKRDRPHLFFISPDSIVQHPNSTQGWARYAYVGNNPMNFTDPTGHYSLSDLEEDFLGFAEKAMPYVVVIGFAFLSVGIGVLAMTPGLPLASKLFLAGMQFTAGMIASRGNVKSSLVGAFSVGFSALSGTSFGTFLGSLTDTGSVIGGILASGVIAAASGGSGTDGLIQGIISSFGAGLSNAMLAV